MKVFICRTLATAALFATLIVLATVATLIAAHFDLGLGFVLMPQFIAGVMFSDGSEWILKKIK